MTYTAELVVVSRPSWPWFHDWNQRRHAAIHQRRIMRQLRRHQGEDGFQIVLWDGREFKIPGDYVTKGGLLKFTHHRDGPVEFAFASIARATSKADH